MEPLSYRLRRAWQTWPKMRFAFRRDERRGRWLRAAATGPVYTRVEVMVPLTFFLP